MSAARRWLRGVLGATLLVACTNDPYSGSDADRKIYYTRFDEAPKTLDPQVSYTTAEHVIIGNVYEGLLQYHYLKRPYELIPAAAEAMPEVETRADGTVSYRFRLRPDLRFHPDTCFQVDPSTGEIDGSRPDWRAATARDVAFVFARIADPAVASPVISTFEKIVGLREFSGKLEARRTQDPGFARLPVHRQYEEIGGIAGVRVTGDLELELVLSETYPQILYWLAMGFTALVPWEAVEYYDGSAAPHFRDHPVGTGPFRLAEYDKQHRMVLRRHDGWYGRLHPQAQAPGTVYPADGEASDAEEGFLDPARVGQPLPALEEIRFYRERESIPSFGKFLQGYYDASGIIKESFDSIVRGDRLSPDMEKRGMRMERGTEPAVYYLGFNMDDEQVGRAGGERSRKLRQAMSLVIDSQEYLRVFQNGRGMPAQSPLPPGLFGYREEYRNPYREVNRERARQLLEEAGYKGGIDPSTGRALQVGFDTPNTEVQALLQYQFFVDAWRSIGLDVQVRATTYNQFQEKVRKGAYQIFQWGWVADYPDPENFLFLLESSNGRAQSNGPNTANFAEPRFDALFAKLKVLPNGPERQAVIDEAVELVQEEAPWIPLYHPEDYALYQPWLAPVKPFGMSYPMVKYWDLDPAERARLRAEWNDPVEWPAFALAGLMVALIVPGIRTYLRERQ
jgi:oligopeptide transport system substrate-binding protein